jgi:hypothetical protein
MIQVWRRLSSLRWRGLETPRHTTVTNHGVLRTTIGMKDPAFR